MRYKNGAGQSFAPFDMGEGDMWRNLIGALIFGLVGAAVLMALGVWQLQRLDWKQQVLAGIEARIGDVPLALPPQVDPVADRYMPVVARGEIGASMLRVLSSRKQVGAGYRVIVPFDTDGRRVMVDLGFLPLEAAMPELAGQVAEITGNLHWPDEIDGFTPAPDMAQNLWFARDVPAMAAALKTEPVLIVRRSGGAPGAVVPMPVDSAGIPNDHLEYAITWFALAFIWLVMTGILVYRIRKTGKAAA